MHTTGRHCPDAPVFRSVCAHSSPPWFGTLMASTWSPLPLIEMREYRLELRRQQSLDALGDRHSTSSCPESVTDRLLSGHP